MREPIAEPAITYSQALEHQVHPGLCLGGPALCPSVYMLFLGAGLLLLLAWLSLGPDLHSKPNSL